jgi:hypothetical protein
MNIYRVHITSICEEDAYEIASLLGVDEMNDGVGDVDNIFD